MKKFQPRSDINTWELACVLAEAGFVLEDSMVAKHGLQRHFVEAPEPRISSQSLAPGANIVVGSDNGDLGSAGGGLGGAV